MKFHWRPIKKSKERKGSAGRREEKEEEAIPQSSAGPINSSGDEEGRRERGRRGEQVGQFPAGWSFNLLNNPKNVSKNAPQIAV